MILVQRAITEHRGSIDPVASGSGRWEERAGLLIALEDELGNRGVGEASPLPGYSRETLDDCRAELSQFAPTTIDDQDPISAVAITSPAARFAVETALLDLTSKRQRRSISALLGRRRASVPLSAILHAEDDAGAIEEARRAIARGIRTVKLKVGKRPLSEELSRIRALRRSLGDGFALRLDANQAWSIEEANRALVALAPFGPELVEEPVRARDWDRLEALVPLALDESLQQLDADRIRALASQKIASALVLKPMALGGFARCLALAELAVELELSCLVTHLFDGPIALAAAAELALSLPGRVLACGLDRHRGLSAWPPTTVPQIAEHEIIASEAFGLGVEVAA